MSGLGWSIAKYPQIPSERIQIDFVSNAIASRAESGSVYWDAPNPRRSFVRGAIYEERGRLVESSQRKGGMNSDMVLSTNPPLLTRREREEATRRRLAGRWVYAGSWMHGFGHFLVETLPTLWPLATQEPEFDGVCAHRFNSLKTFGWQSELLGLLTRSPLEVIDDAPATFEQLAVPARPYHYQVAINPVARLVWDLVSERAASQTPTAPTNGRPVYLSRTKFQKDQRSRGIVTGREFLNSEDVDEVFSDAGFLVVDPQEMTVREQVTLARSAPILAGPSGSALHLSVFSGPGSRVIEVGDARTRSTLVATQQAISSVKNQPTAQIPYATLDDGSVDTGALRSALLDLNVSGHD